MVPAILIGSSGLLDSREKGVAMKKTLWEKLTILTLLLILPAAVSAAEIAVIANDQFPKHKITVLELKKIYLGKKIDESGVKIRPIDQADVAPVKRQFIGKIIGASIGKYKAYWLKRIFREGSTPPIVFFSSREVVQSVRKEKGAIGYLPASELPDRDGFKVLLILSVKE